MIQVSKQLLSAVFSEREKLHYIGVGIHRIVNCSGNICEYEIHTGNFNNLNDDTAYRSINIYELMHLMKVWAKDEVYYLESGYISGAVCRVYLDLEDMKIFWADTEPEAVFKACEWILED